MSGGPDFFMNPLPRDEGADQCAIMNCVKEKDYRIERCETASLNESKAREAVGQY